MEDQWWGLLFTFIFTLAQAGRLSLQLLWTEELQSGKKRRGEYYMMAEGRGCVCGKVGARKSDWSSELARKLHQPTNESQTGAEHVMQSKGNTAREGRREGGGRKPA